MSEKQFLENRVDQNTNICTIVYMSMLVQHAEQILLSPTEALAAVAAWERPGPFFNGNHDGDGTPRHRPHVTISADITTIITDAPEATNDDTGRPMSPACVATYLCDCQIHVILRDADGTPETFGRTTYSVPAACSVRSQLATAAAASPAAIDPSATPTPTTSSVGNMAALRITATFSHCAHDTTPTCTRSSLK